MVLKNEEVLLFDHCKFYSESDSKTKNITIPVTIKNITVPVTIFNKIVIRHYDYCNPFGKLTDRDKNKILFYRDEALVYSDIMNNDKAKETIEKILSEENDLKF